VSIIKDILHDHEGMREALPPRKPRFNLPGIPQHVIQRGNDREPCFFTKADYHRYLDDLRESATRFPRQLYAGVRSA